MSNIIEKSVYTAPGQALDPTTQTVQSYIEQKKNSKHPELLTIAFVVSNKSEVHLNRIFENTRKREVAQARQLCMYFAERYTILSLGNIGRFYNRDHSTVLHAIKTINNLIDIDKSFKSFVEDIDLELRALLKKNEGKYNVTVDHTKKKVSLRIGVDFDVEGLRELTQYIDNNPVAKNYKVILK